MKFTYMFDNINIDKKTFYSSKIQILTTLKQMNLFMTTVARSRFNTD